MRTALMFSLFLVGISGGFASHRQFGDVEVLVDGVPVSRYLHDGTTYVEAVKGKEYAIRITNPTGARVAVALSVDGLNTIDARHTSARSANKWVLGPYESAVISGWQTGAGQARRFFFTTEGHSYGAWLGNTENFGIISAAFFRERFPVVVRPMPEHPRSPMAHLDSSPGAPQERAQAEAAGSGSQAKAESAERPPAHEPEYAATGMGDRVRHEVQWIRMDLEDQPYETVDLRYEFRPVLVRLGVVPPQIARDPLVRRENARGFRDTPYCPEP
jgi:hypothetical protein